MAELLDAKFAPTTELLNNILRENQDVSRCGDSSGTASIEDIIDHS